MHGHVLATDDNGGNPGNPLRSYRGLENAEAYVHATKDSGEKVSDEENGKTEEFYAEKSKRKQKRRFGY